MKRPEPAYIFDDRFIDIMPPQPSQHPLHVVFEEMAAGMREEKAARDADKQLYLLITWWVVVILTPFAPLFLWQAIRPKNA